MTRLDQSICLTCGTNDKASFFGPVFLRVDSQSIKRKIILSLRLCFAWPINKLDQNCPKSELLSGPKARSFDLKWTFQPQQNLQIFTRETAATSITSQSTKIQHYLTGNHSGCHLETTDSRLNSPQIVLSLTKCSNSKEYGTHRLLHLDLVDFDSVQLVLEITVEGEFVAVFNVFALQTEKLHVNSTPLCQKQGKDTYVGFMDARSLHVHTLGVLLRTRALPHAKDCSTRLSSPSSANNTLENVPFPEPMQAKRLQKRHAVTSGNFLRLGRLDKFICVVPWFECKNSSRRKTLTNARRLPHIFQTQFFTLVEQQQTQRLEQRHL